MVQLSHVGLGLLSSTQFCRPCSLRVSQAYAHSTFMNEKQTFATKNDQYLASLAEEGERVVRLPLEKSLQNYYLHL